MDKFGLPDGWSVPGSSSGRGDEHERLNYSDGQVQNGLGLHLTKEEFDKIQEAIIQFSTVATRVLVQALQRAEADGQALAKIPGIDIQGLAIYPPNPELSPRFFLHFYLKPPDVKAELKTAIYRQEGEVYTTDGR